MKPFLHLLLIAFASLLIFSGCCKKCTEKTAPIQKEAPYVGINVKIPDGGSLTDLTNEIEKKLGIKILPALHVKTCPCDPTLVNINFPGLVFTGHGQLPAQADPQGHGDSLNLPGFIASKNYIIFEDKEDDYSKQDDKTYPSELNILSTYSGPTNPTGSVTVAIFDSGLDAQYLDKSYVGVPFQLDTCLTNQIPAAERDRIQNGGIVRGLNFAPPIWPNGYKISEITDSQQKQHGTNVAALIVNQYKRALGAKALRLLIMRVLNEENTGDGFGVMCAMYHAKRMGADIYNMSLGYYGPEDPIFKQYIESIKSNKPSWLVAAAGNRLSSFDAPGTTPDSSINRNLDQRIATSKFYPAYFSASLAHVVSVTTAEVLSRVCTKQNYDPKSVNVGVLAPNCAFFSPGIRGPVHGTSYATPVAAGWIAAQTNIGISRPSLLAPVPKDSGLMPFIVDGKYIKYEP